MNAQADRTFILVDDQCNFLVPVKTLHHSFKLTINVLSALGLCLNRMGGSLSQLKSSTQKTLIIVKQYYTF